MLEKILDKYYAKKLGEAIIGSLSQFYLEKYFVIAENKLKFYFNYCDIDKKLIHAKMLFSIPISNSLECLIHKKGQIIKELRERIEKEF